jgi:hypothetical protein
MFIWHTYPRLFRGLDTVLAQIDRKTLLAIHDRGHVDDSAFRTANAPVPSNDGEAKHNALSLSAMFTHGWCHRSRDEA